MNDNEIKANAESWDYAFGLVRVAGLEPSPYFLELVERQKAGEITREDIRKYLSVKYEVEVD